MATKSTTLANMILFGATVPKIGGGYCGSYKLRTFRLALRDGTITLPNVFSFLAVESLDKQPGWQSMTFRGGKAKQEFVFEHHYIHTAEAGGKDYPNLDDDLRTMADNYYTALEANPFMEFNGVTAFQMMPKVTEQITPYEWWDKVYYEVIFRISTGIYK